MGADLGSKPALLLRETYQVTLSYKQLWTAILSTAPLTAIILDIDINSKHKMSSMLSSIQCYYDSLNYALILCRLHVKSMLMLSSKLMSFSSSKFDVKYITCMGSAVILSCFGIRCVHTSSLTNDCLELLK
jgi:uncharacterized membrane protein YkvI